MAHSMQDVRRSCTRGIWLDNGQLKMDGAPEDVIAAYEDTDEKREQQRLQRTKRKAERALQQLAELDEEEAAAVVESTAGETDSRSA